MAEGLDIMDNSINLASLELGGDVLYSLIYRVRVSIVRVLFSQGISRLRHSKLALNLIKYHPGTITLKVRVKVLGVDRGDTDIRQPEAIRWVGLTPSASS